MSTGRLGAGDTAIQPTIFDAKADILTATAADTPARLAVGNNGETLVADSSATTGLRWQGDYAAGKNKIINGDFRINQRGFSSTTTDATYGLDRWVISNATGTVTYSSQAFTPGAAPVSGYEAINFARIVTTGQSGTGAEAALVQNIEDVRTLAGQTATISFWAKANTGTPKIAVEFRQNFGSGGSPSSVVNTYAGQATLSTSWARYSITVAIPSISGKTIGTTANTSYLTTKLYVSAGSGFDSRTGSLGIQTNTFDIWGVQVEAGSVATAFQTATGTLAGELAACQRYYFRFNSNANEVLIPAGFANSTTAASGRIQYPVPMRVVPTSLDSANLQFGNYAGTTYAMTSVAYNQASNVSAQVYGTVTGTTAGHVGAILGSASNAYVGLNAEL
jgi:hypothetical protein